MFYKRHWAMGSEAETKTTFFLLILNKLFKTRGRFLWIFFGDSGIPVEFLEKIFCTRLTWVSTKIVVWDLIWQNKSEINSFIALEANRDPKLRSSGEERGSSQLELQRKVKIDRKSKIAQKIVRKLTRIQWNPCKILPDIQISKVFAPLYELKNNKL